MLLTNDSTPPLVLPIREYDTQDKIITEKGMALGKILERRLGTFLRKADEARSRTLMDSLLEGGRKNIIMVTGEFDNTFYTHEIGEHVANSLQRGAIVNIILTEKKEGNVDESIRMFAKENFEFFLPIFNKIIDQLITIAVLERFRIYFSRKRQDYHFTVVDDDVFMESKHERNKSRCVFVRQSSKVFSKKYNSFFNEILEDNNNVYRIDNLALLKSIKCEKDERETFLKHAGLCG
jgi:hypothetical protein